MLKVIQNALPDKVFLVLEKRLKLKFSEQIFDELRLTIHNILDKIVKDAKTNTIAKTDMISLGKAGRHKLIFPEKDFERMVKTLHKDKTFEDIKFLQKLVEHQIIILCKNGEMIRSATMSFVESEFEHTLEEQQDEKTQKIIKYMWKRLQKKFTLSPYHLQIITMLRD